MFQDRAACTIIAKNYLAFARTLAQSFLSFHPDLKFYVLIVDDYNAYINPADECFEILKLTDLEIPNLPGFCFKYDVQELCTASKAYLLDYLVREKAVRRLLYLDPDILVTSSLNELYEKLGTYDIVLTPHLDTDYPDDDLLPDDGYILRAGQFNLGFIGINASDNANSFLNWWKPKLYEKCVVDLLHGYFVDQKFIDFVPIFFRNVLIETDTGYNVAYWNLHSRRIIAENDAWKCNEGPLYFFHFSGYDSDSGAISSHIPVSLARHLLSDGSDLKSFFDEYKERLINNGHKQATVWPYTFATFKTGEAIPYNVRVYYRSLPGKGRGLGDPFESDRLKRQAAGAATSAPVTALTDTEQLNAILNSRAWRWVCRYGRFNERYLMPAADLSGRLFGSRRAERASAKVPREAQNE
jgi:lipopolysaccharide biosynthesis glycosyltransferase